MLVRKLNPGNIGLFLALEVGAAGEGHKRMLGFSANIGRFRISRYCFGGEGSEDRC